MWLPNRSTFFFHREIRDEFFSLLEGIKKKFIENCAYVSVSRILTGLRESERDSIEINDKERNGKSNIFISLRKCELHRNTH